MLAQVLRDGGPVLAFLVLLSLASLALIFWKALRLASVTRGRARRAAALAAWEEGRRPEAQALAAQGAAPADRLLEQAMGQAARGRPAPLIEAEATRRGNEELADLASGIRLLELIAMVSPLIGLLGTVLGMIRSFRELALAEGSANAAVLAGGIWEALLTTAAGLVVAIPAAVGAGLLSARVERAGLAVESALGAFLALLGPDLPQPDAGVASGTGEVAGGSRASGTFGTAPGAAPGIGPSHSARPDTSGGASEMAAAPDPRRGG